MHGSDSNVKSFDMLTETIRVGKRITLQQYFTAFQHTLDKNGYKIQLQRLLLRNFDNLSMQYLFI